MSSHSTELETRHQIGNWPERQHLGRCRVWIVAGQFRDSGLVSWMRAAGHGVTALKLASGCGSGERDEHGTGIEGGGGVGPGGNRTPTVIRPSPYTFCGWTVPRQWFGQLDESSGWSRGDSGSDWRLDRLGRARRARDGGRGGGGGGGVRARRGPD